MVRTGAIRYTNHLQVQIKKCSAVGEHFLNGIRGSWLVVDNAASIFRGGYDPGIIN